MDSDSSSSTEDHLNFSSPKEATEHQTRESGLGAEPPFTPSFPIGVSASKDDTDQGGFMEKAVYAPLSVNIAYPQQVLRPAEGNDRLHDLSLNVLQESSPHDPMGGAYPIPERDSGNFFQFHNEKCQEIARVVRKTTLASKSRESATYSDAKYVMKKIKELDRQSCQKDRKMRKLESQIESLKFESDQMEKSLEFLKQHSDQAEVVAEEHIEYLEQFDKPEFHSDEEEATQTKGLPNNSPKVEQLSNVEQQVEGLQQMIKALKNDNASKDAKISLLQTQHFDSEKENETNGATVEILTDEIQVLVQSVYQIIEYYGQKHLHQQVSEKSKFYGRFMKTRTPRVAEVYFGAPHLTHSTASVPACTHRNKPENMSTPVRPEPHSYQSYQRVTHNTANVQRHYKPESTSTPAQADPAWFDSSDRRTSQFADLSLADNFDHNDAVQGDQTNYDVEIPLHDMVCLAAFFDCIDLLVDLLKLTAAEKGEAKLKKDKEDYQTAVHFCLSCWRKHDPRRATFQKLLRIVRRLGKEEIASKIETYFKEERD